MKKIKNLILIFLLMFVGVFSVSALTNDDMEYIEEEFRSLSSMFYGVDGENFEYEFFKENENPSLEGVQDYIFYKLVWQIENNEYKYILNKDFEETVAPTVNSQIPAADFESAVAKSFNVTDDWYEELRKNYHPGISQKSEYKEIDGKYYYYSENMYNLGMGTIEQTFFHGYKDLGNNQYQIYVYKTLDKETYEAEKNFYEGLELSEQNNDYIIRKNYNGEDTEYVILSCLTSKIEYKDEIIKYLSFEEVAKENMPKDSELILYQETSDTDETVNNPTTGGDKEPVKINVSDKIWYNFLTELSKTITDFEYGEDYLEYEPDSYTHVEYYYKDGILTLDVENSRGEWIYGSIRNVLQVAMKDWKYGEKGHLIATMLSTHEKYGLNNTFTLKNDGIEYVITKKELDFECTACLVVPIIESFSIDLKNGLNMESLKKFHKGTNDYKYLDGEDQKININKDKKLIFRLDADYKLFNGVYIDGKEVDKKNYTVTEGSTVITFNEEYTKKIAEGKHTMKATFTDGKQSITEFTVEIENPKTGVSFEYSMFALIVLVGILGYVLIKKQRKFPNHN